jgi:hypothetical protein
MYTMKPCHQMAVTYVIAVFIKKIGEASTSRIFFINKHQILPAHKECCNPQANTKYQQTNSDDG